jgi:hypothetical protein
MPRGVRPLIRPFRFTASVAVFVAWFIGLACVASAQQPVIAEPPAGAEFFSRSDFHLNAAWLGASTVTPSTNLTAEQQRFVWDTFWGGSVDVLDYVDGRLAVIIDYEAVLGSEFQPFDPNQGNYTLEGSGSARLGPNAELVGIFHHVSRHLSDRAKSHLPVAYNELGARYLQRVGVGGSTVDVDLEGGRTVERAYVDYTWLADLNVLARTPLTPRLGLFAHVAGHLVGVDASVAHRDRQSGGMFEAGVRINGRGGAMELFAGAEKRLDAYPLDRQPEHWFLAGFRLLSR